MRRSTPASFLTCVVALLAGASLAVAAPSDSAKPNAKSATRSYIQVSAREYYYGLSRNRVKPGTVTFELVNYGEDDHDLAITRKGTSSTVKSIVANPGERVRVSRKLRKGTYILWCTITDHQARGMSATLRVRN